MNKERSSILPYRRVKGCINQLKIKAESIYDGLFARLRALPNIPKLFRSFLRFSVLAPFLWCKQMVQKMVQKWR